MKKFNNRRKINKKEIEEYNFKEVALTKMAKRQLLLTLFSILGVTIISLGSAYAVFTSISKSADYNVIKVGTLNIDFGEDSSNSINLSGQYPMSDEDGLKLKPYVFTIKNTGSLAADYEVFIQDDLDMINSEEENCANIQLNKDYIRYKLDTAEPANLSSIADSNYKIATGSLEAGGSVTYTLYVWIREGVGNDVLNKHYHGKIVVNGVNTQSDPVSEVVLANVGDNGSTYNDDVDTFITGEDPNNYIWYSGKLWRAVSVNNEAKTTKLVTQWNISSISYNEINNSSFEGSYMEDWLNDTTVDGFLGNLRDYENFIVTDAKWNATEDATSLGSITRPSDSGTVVTDAVGLLNMYEYQSSNKGGINGYLNNGLYWWTLTPNSSTTLVSISPTGETITDLSHYADGIRPSINLRSDVKIVSGSGTENDPYRLLGDSDTNLSGTKLNTRYSGEYIRFGTGDNNLYRIVSHETPELTKIVNSEPLKENGEFINLSLNPNEVKDFINNVFISDYFEDGQFSMISENTVWYWSSVSDGESYKLAKYKNINGDELISNTSIDTIGLLRLGELMTGQFNRYTSRENVNTGLTSKYWLNTMEGDKNKYVQDKGGLGIAASGDSGLKLAFNLKSNVIITGGDGTKNNPFILELAS